MREIRKKARERVKTRCRVCPVCDGKACAGEVPGMGGMGTGMGFRNNVSSLAKITLNMRVLHDADEPDTRFILWGQELSLPVFAAPLGAVGPNLGSDMTDAEYTRLLIAGCAKAGTLAGIGDMPVLENFTTYLDSIGSFGKATVPFIKPWTIEAVEKRMDLVAGAGCAICGMDVDSVGLAAMRRLNPSVVMKPGPELAKCIRLAHERGMKFIVKGIMTPDEAVIACEAGADAVLVSNHGGRVLDHARGGAEVLPAIARAVGGRSVVMIDGGIRSGEDVLKVLALGAKAALICRPVSIMLHGDEENGVPVYFDALRQQLCNAMRLTGCGDLASIDARVVE